MNEANAKDDVCTDELNNTNNPGDYDSDSHSELSFINSLDSSFSTAKQENNVDKVTKTSRYGRKIKERNFLSSSLAATSKRERDDVLDMFTNHKKLKAKLNKLQEERNDVIDTGTIAIANYEQSTQKYEELLASAERDDQLPSWNYQSDCFIRPTKTEEEIQHHLKLNLEDKWTVIRRLMIKDLTFVLTTSLLTKANNQNNDSIAEDIVIFLIDVVAYHQDASLSIAAHSMTKELLLCSKFAASLNLIQAMSSILNSFGFKVKSDHRESLIPYRDEYDRKWRAEDLTHLQLILVLADFALLKYKSLSQSIKNAPGEGGALATLFLQEFCVSLDVMVQKQGTIMALIRNGLKTWDLVIKTQSQCAEEFLERCSEYLQINSLFSIDRNMQGDISWPRKVVFNLTTLEFLAGRQAFESIARSIIFHLVKKMTDDAQEKNLVAEIFVQATSDDERLTLKGLDAVLTDVRIHHEHEKVKSTDYHRWVFNLRVLSHALEITIFDSCFKGEKRKLRNTVVNYLKAIDSSIKNKYHLACSHLQEYLRKIIKFYGALNGSDDHIFFGTKRSTTIEGSFFAETTPRA